MITILMTWTLVAAGDTTPSTTSPASAPIEAVLLARAPSAGEALRWSPKGATVALTREGDALAGRFELGPQGSSPIAVRLAKSAGAAHFDRLWVDVDRDGRASDVEWCLDPKPNETRGKWWSSFRANVPIAVPAEGSSPATTRAYPLSLWFVEDPSEPQAAPTLRWSREGWHEGTVTIDGKPAFVLVTEMRMDGVFDQRDAWALARDHGALLRADPRDLEEHAWLDGVAYRPVRIDPHGRRLSFERFDPGFTEAEETAKRDVYAPDRDAPRAKTPLAFGHDYAAALARAAQEKKRVLVDFETTWCGPCQTMNRIVYTADAVVTAAKDVVCVKVDGDEHKDLAKQYGVTGYPTLVLLDADGKELRRAVGYRGVAAMVELLKP